MGRLIAITTSDLQYGFQLAGVDTFSVDRPEEAQRLLRDLLEKEDVSLIVVRQDLLRGLDPRLQRRLELSYRPVVMPIPGGAPETPEESHRKYIAELIRRAIGFQITFGSEGPRSPKP